MTPRKLAHPRLFAYWACECGHEEEREPNEKCKGTTVLYRVAPCPVCKRSMALMQDGRGEMAQNKWPW